MPSENGLTETQNIVLGCFIIATVMAAYIGGALWLGAKIGRGWAAALLLLLGVGIVGFFFRTLLKTSALHHTIRALIDADSWEAAQLMVEQHPELLSDHADEILDQLSRQTKDVDASCVYEEYRVLLRRCREVGIETAFAEKAEVQKLPEENHALSN